MLMEEWKPVDKMEDIQVSDVRVQAAAKSLESCLIRVRILRYIRGLEAINHCRITDLAGKGTQEL